MKGEHISDIKGKTSSWTIKEITPNGVKMEMNDEGQITGKYNANFMETTTVNMKPDGTSTWESKGLHTSGADMLVVMGKGTGKQINPTTTTFEGELTYMTQSPKLAWLNNTKGWCEGTANQGERHFTAKVHAKK